MIEINARDPTGELKGLVRRAQGYEQGAIDELYARFRGMVINCIRREEVRRAFGEDAENVAWEVFYEVVQGMKVEHVRCVESVLKAGLYNGITKRLMASSSRGVTYLEDEEENVLADPRDTYETVVASYVFASFLKELSEDGRRLMQLLFIEGVSLAEASKRLGRSYKATAKLKYKCLRKFKEYLKG